MSELVRDKVPNILKQQGLNPDYVLLEQKDGMRKVFVKNKFISVSGELVLAMNLAKPEDILMALAKTLDLVHQIAKEEKIKMTQVRESRRHLRGLKGKYQDFVILHAANKTNYPY